MSIASPISGITRNNILRWWQDAMAWLLYSKTHKPHHNFTLMASKMRSWTLPWFSWCSPIRQASTCDCRFSIIDYRLDDRVRFLRYVEWSNSVRHVGEFSISILPLWKDLVKQLYDECQDFAIINIRWSANSKHIRCNFPAIASWEIVQICKWDRFLFQICHFTTIPAQCWEAQIWRRAWKQSLSSAKYLCFVLKWNDDQRSGRKDGIESRKCWICNKD